MTDLNKVVNNNTDKIQRGNFLKVHGGDWPFTDIRTSISSGDRGGESTKDRILRHSDTPRGRPGVVRQHAWSAQPSDWSSVVLTAYS
jgi:hypothetical protein